MSTPPSCLHIQSRKKDLPGRIQLWWLCQNHTPPVNMTVGVWDIGGEVRDRRLMQQNQSWNTIFCWWVMLPWVQSIRCGQRVPIYHRYLKISWHKIIEFHNETHFIYQSPYAHNFIMRTGIPICEFFIDPRPFAYGDPHMQMAIPICKIMHMGIQN